MHVVCIERACFVEFISRPINSPTLGDMIIVFYRLPSNLKMIYRKGEIGKEYLEGRVVGPGQEAARLRF